MGIDKIRLLWSSNAIWSKQGYGVPGKNILPRLMARGVQCAQFAWYGLQGGRMSLPMQYGGKQVGSLLIYPCAFDQYGNDIIGGYAKDFQSNLVLSLMDIWVQPPQFREMVGVPWLAWFPVDHTPCPTKIVERAKLADYPAVYSKFGVAEIEKVGVAARYLPIGVDCGAFSPGSQKAARAMFKDMPQEGYWIVMVGANKGVPSRKGFPEALLIFKEFHKRHPEALLYLHTLKNANCRGLDFVSLIQSIPDFPADAVHFPDELAYTMGFDDASLANVYRAADVLIQPSYNEGFGVPIIEAQACGVPVIVNGTTSMPELCFSGFVVPPTQPTYSTVGLDGWAGAPDIDGFVAALERVYDMGRGERGKKMFADDARGGAMEYDWDAQFEKYWLPLMEEIAGKL